MRIPWRSWWPVMVFLIIPIPNLTLCTMKTVTVNFTSKNLSAVPSDLPSYTERLDLSKNHIQAIRKDDFSNTANLHFLNVSWNMLEDIQQDTFIATPVLTKLDLSHNRLRNLFDQHYLLQALSLEYLDLSANLFATMALGSEFSRLTNLKWLGLSADTIKNKDLYAISVINLETLFIQGQNLRNYENGSLTGVKTKKIVIVMPNKQFDFQIILDALSYFKEVEFSGLLYPNNFLQKVMNYQISIHTVHLHLSDVHTTWNGFTNLTNSAIISPIKHLSLYQVTLTNMNDGYQVIQTNYLDSFTISQSSVTVFLFEQKKVYDFIINMPAKNITFSQSPVIHMTCPIAASMIQMLDLSDCPLTERIFSEGHQECATLTSLKTLVLKGNNLRLLMPLSSRAKYMNSLKHVDLRKNSLTYEEEQGKCTWPATIIQMDLSSNAFDQSVFKCLPKAVVILNLQNNQIRTIPVNISGLESLRVLDLTSNRLLDLPGCLGYPKLQKLVLQGNALHAPSTSSLVTCPNLIILDTSKNPYICTCPLRKFTTLIDDNGLIGGGGAWKNGRITVAHWPDGYRCSYPEYWKNMRLKNVRLPLVTCSAGLLSITILAPALAFIIAVGLLCHRLDLPWYMGMVWKWTQAKHRSKKAQRRPEELQGVSFHAFISYSQRNAEWVKGQLLPKLEGEDLMSNGLRVCHHERNFIPGKPIVQNILHCIEQSRCCVFVLSSHFVQSEWCHYELYFANHQRLTRGLDNIILVLLEPIPTYLIPSKYYQLKAMMARRTYLEWPQDKTKQKMFWANLRAALQAELPNPITNEEEHD